MLQLDSASCCAIHPLTGNVDAPCLRTLDMLRSLMMNLPISVPKLYNNNELPSTVWWLNFSQVDVSDASRKNSEAMPWKHVVMLAAQCWSAGVHQVSPIIKRNAALHAEAQDAILHVCLLMSRYSEGCMMWPRNARIVESLAHASDQASSW